MVTRSLTMVAIAPGLMLMSAGSAAASVGSNISGYVAPVGGRGGDAGGELGRVRWADWDGDGKADRLTVADGGAVDVSLNRGGDGHGGWEPLGQISAGS
ncbi:hypothetical protein DRB96_15955 [Streptomyces sp. ICC1]|nr:hypothetical protein DRB89_16720 [Streptomyces sp. ICC4]AWZ13549.1 hypothetical protein DRB96_15955 [Streptomyces sp. ICC1]